MLLMAALTALAAACSEAAQPLAPVMLPAAPRAVFTADSGHLIVRGFTTDRNFNRYLKAPTYFLTGDYTFHYDTVQPWALDSVTVKGFGSGELLSMNGGETYVSSTLDGHEIWLGSASGDMENSLQVFGIPAAATVTLLAHPNEGCRFLWWEDSQRVKYYGNPLVIPPTGRLIIQREAWYQCGTGPHTIGG
jgi:hypothetical protein